MNHKPLFSKLHLFVFFALSLLYCSTNETSTYAAPPDGDGANGGDDNGNGGSGTVQYAEIDFSNWKVTLPVDEDNNGSPDEYYSDTLINYGYQTLEPVQPFMYDDTDYLTVTGYFPVPMRGEEIKFFGDFKDHPKYGTQYVVKNYEKLSETSVAGLVEYLSSDLLVTEDYYDGRLSQIVRQRV